MRCSPSFAIVLVLFAFGCPKRSPGPAENPDASVVIPSASTSASSTRSPVDTVTSASASADASSHVVLGGAVDGEALRSRHRARIANDKSPVTILAGGSPRTLGQRLCESVVPERPKNTPILIKPNLGGFEWFKDPAKSGGDDGVRGRITDPEFVRGIVRCLKARGHDRVTIAEGWGGTHQDWKRLVDVSGYAAMAREEHIPLVAMDDDGVFDVQGDKPGLPLVVRGMEKTHAPTLLMPKILAEHLEHGLFISAPKIKAHRFGVTSMAIKGMQGTVMLSDASPAFHQKWRMHKELSDALKLLGRDKDAGQRAYLASLDVFAERMVDCLEVAAPDVVLAEGAPAMAGNGFDKRWPLPESIAVGGTQPIFVDRVGAQVLGLWDNAELAHALGGHATSPLITKAAERFGVDLASVTTKGDGVFVLSAKRPVHFVSMSGFSIHSDDTPPERAPARASSESDAGATPTAVAVSTNTPIVIDGAPEEAWNAARPVDFDTDWSGKKTDIPTHVRFLWSKDALYMQWLLENAGIVADATRPVKAEREKLYEEDCVELFLGTDPARRTRYFEVEVGPFGHFLDLAVDRVEKKSDPAWSSAPEIATSVDREGRRAVIEVALRSPDITRALVKGAHLPLALYRMEGKGKRSYLAWSPTMTERPNFHVPEAFGTLVLE